MTDNSEFDEFDEQSGRSTDRPDRPTDYIAETLEKVRLCGIYPNLPHPLSGKSIYAKFNNQELVNFFIASEGDSGW